MDFNMADFDKYREDNRREVKKAKGGLPNSLWDTYSSFANCYGGVIILGVAEREDGSWYTTGLTDERKLKKDFWDTINNKKKVNQNILTDKNVTTYTDKTSGHAIMVISVPAAKRDQKPIYINDDIFNGTFRRNWEGDYHCSKSEIRAMLRDETESTMDMKVIENLSVDQLNMESVHGYRNRHRSFRPAHPWNDLDDAIYLKNIGAASIGEDGNLHPTAAGLLMFGDEYQIVREFPEYFLDYREMLDPSIRWTDRLYSSTGEWSGNLFDFYFRVYNKLIKDIKVPFKLVGGDRIDDTPVHKAIREALANCLINTDYYVGRGVVIKKDADKIVMENPGYIRVGKYQMRVGGESDPRNKALMKMFNLIDIGERAGSGVPELFSTWEKQGWEEPIIEERFGDAERTTVILPLKNKVAEKSGRKKVAEKNRQKKRTTKTQERLDAIMENMESGKTYSAEEVALLIGVQRSRAKELLGMLIEEEKITAEGVTKGRKYLLK